MHSTGAGIAPEGGSARPPVPEGTRSSTFSRILGVVRLQYINKYVFVWIPAIVAASAVVISIAIYAMVGADEPMYGGGSQAPLWYFLVIGIQAMTLTFPFSQALSLTRREFFLGTLLAAGIAAAFLASLYAVLGSIEQATNGYGINGYVISLPWLWGYGWTSAATLTFAMALFFFLAGFWFATIYRRGGTVVVTLVGIGLAVLALAAAFVITRLEAWGDVVRWVGQLGPFGAAGIVGIIVVVLAVGSWFTLRRSVP